MKRKRIWMNRRAVYIQWLGFVSTLVLLLGHAAAGTDKLYWTDYRGIHRVDLDGGNMETPVPIPLVFPIDVAVDEKSGKIYWSDYRTRKIQRSNLDGTNIEDLITATSGSPWHIAVDAIGRKIYWTDTSIIQRANLDGTEVEDLVTQQNRLWWPRGIAVDSNGKKIYWADSDSKRIQRSNLDGTEIEDIVTDGLQNPYNVVVDPIEGKIYWTDKDTFYRADLDGKNVEELKTGATALSAIAIDLAVRKLYWSDWNSGKINRSNLDGTDVEYVFTTGAKRVFGVAVDADRRKIYWTDPKFPPQILRANLDGTDSEVLISTELSPYGIALDPSARKIYWTNNEAGRIQRSNFDGSNIENLVVDGFSWFSGISLDTNGEKMYWADSGRGIRRSNLNGTDVETLVVNELAYPIDIAVDVNNSKMYWTNYKLRKIQRSNLDGTDVEDLLELNRVPQGIALDVYRYNIFSTTVDFATGAGAIRCLNFDGTDRQILFIPNNVMLEKTRLYYPLGIAVDPYGGKIYWRDLNPSRIHRANFDGTDPEDVITGIHGSGFIALDLTQATESWSTLNHQGLKPTSWGRIRGNALFSNFPNPFNPETWIPYQLAEATHVRIRIYDVAGHLVRTLDLGAKPAGSYLSRDGAAYWDGRNNIGEAVGSGVYFYTLGTGNYRTTRRLTVAR